MIDYSVIIRTTGKAGTKYQRLLQSIAGLDPQPKEVIVVLPEGYALPEDQLGWETFYHCPKGMVIQRLYGIAQCKTPYALICDDDIAFAPDFVQKLHTPVKAGAYGLSAGPLTEFFPGKGLPTIMSALTGASCPTCFHKDRYNTVLRTTGYSFNRNLQPGKLYETQSAPWTCFYADMEKLRSIHFEDELWLDLNGYSAHDDTAMFYKAWLRGVKSVIVTDAPYQHLDAKTSTRGNMEKALYATGFNNVVFWHRFLSGRNPVECVWSRICIRYRLFTQKLYHQLNRLRGRMSDGEITAFDNGVTAGWSWINTSTYQNLPSVLEETYEDFGNRTGI